MDKRIELLEERTVIFLEKTKKAAAIGRFSRIKG